MKLPSWENVYVFISTSCSMSCLSTSVHIYTHTHHRNPHTYCTCLVITPISQLSEAERVYGSFMGGEAALGSPFGCPYKWLIFVCACACASANAYMCVTRWVTMLAYHWAFVRAKGFFTQPCTSLCSAECVFRRSATQVCPHNRVLRGHITVCSVGGAE